MKTVRSLTPAEGRNAFKDADNSLVRSRAEFPSSVHILFLCVCVAPNATKKTPPFALKQNSGAGTEKRPVRPTRA